MLDRQHIWGGDGGRKYGKNIADAIISRRKSFIRTNKK